MAEGSGSKTKDEIRFMRCEADFGICNVLIIDVNSCLLIHTKGNKDDKGEEIDESCIS